MVPGTDGDGEVGGVVGDDAGRRVHQRDVVAGRRRATHLPVGPATDRGDDRGAGRRRRAASSSVGDRGHQIHAPSGTRCSSPQRLPAREDLARVRPPRRVERVAQPRLGVEVVGR